MRTASYTAFYLLTPSLKVPPSSTTTICPLLRLSSALPLGLVAAKAVVEVLASRSLCPLSSVARLATAVAASALGSIVAVKGTSGGSLASKSGICNCQYVYTMVSPQQGGKADLPPYWG